MKKQMTLTVIMMLMINSIFGQVMGNANYQHRVHLPQNIVQVPYPANDEFLITVKGISNVNADNYVAIFSVKQAGKNAGEVNELIDERLKPLIEYCEKETDMSSYIDMISFVPIYEMEVVNKIFSKKTYNEVPKGFEVKKNIHIRYRDPQKLNEIVKVAAGSEIYDLVRVDYFADDLKAKKQELMKKAREILATKMNHQKDILDIEIVNYNRRASDGFTVVYPIEMYKQYQAATTNKFSVDNTANVNRAQKQTTHYYKPYFDKDFDFSINPTVFEPQIQIMYEMKVLFKPKPKEDKQPPKTEEVVKMKKDIILLTPTGEMKTIHVQ